MTDLFTVQKLMKLYDYKGHKNSIIYAENKGDIPKAERSSGGHRKWNYQSLPLIGEKYGFIKKLERPYVVVIFSKKGGIWKTTFAYNLARMVALHNNPTLITGLDDQNDITGACGHDFGINEDMPLSEVRNILEQGLESLADLIDNEHLRVDDLVYDTEIPTLKYIPESPELDYLEEKVSGLMNRELWLLQKVFFPLREKFRFFVIDLPPAWNQLTNNALMAADVVISPIECKWNQWKNLKFFRARMNRFKESTGAHFKHIFIPVKVNDKKILSREIKEDYTSNIEGCLPTGIKVHSNFEDSMAQNKSILEHAPSSNSGEEFRQILETIWPQIISSDSGLLTLENRFSQIFKKNRK